jgi:hypothetical protein
VVEVKHLGVGVHKTPGGVERERRGGRENERERRQEGRRRREDREGRG